MNEVNIKWYNEWVNVTNEKQSWWTTSQINEVNIEWYNGWRKETYIWRRVNTIMNEWKQLIHEGNVEWNTDNERKWWMKYGQWKKMVNEIRTMKENGEWNTDNESKWWMKSVK